MNKFVIFLSLLGLLLAACTNQVNQPTQAIPEPSPAAVEPVPAASTVQPPSSQPAPSEAAPAAQVVTYKLAPSESTATYEVGETFFNQNNRFALAVGITPQVSGEVQIDFSDPRNSKIGPIEIDISQLTSDSSRRDNVIRERYLESNRFPIARFVPTSYSGLPESYSPGEEITFQVTGDLTVKETTRPVTFDVTARIEGDLLMGTAAATILMSDFNAGPINTGMLQTEDEAKLTLTFVGKP